MFFGSTPAVPVDKAAARIGEPGVALVDVRTPAEYADGHAKGAVNFPLDTLDENQAAQLKSFAEVYVICRSGGRSASATSALVGSGVKAINVSGGMLAWSARGLPVVLE